MPAHHTDAPSRGRRARRAQAAVGLVVVVLLVAGLALLARAFGDSGDGMTSAARTDGRPDVGGPAPSIPPAPAPTPGATPTGPAYPPWPELGPSLPGDFLPAPADLADDLPDHYLDGCHQSRTEEAPVSCTYGDPDSSTVVALVGDSHAAHWLPGLRTVAESRGWRLEVFTKYACPLADIEVWVRRDDAPYTSCSVWNEAVLPVVIELRPSLVVTSLSGEYDVVVDGRKVAAGAEADAHLSAALARSWGVVADAGLPLAVLTDTPWYPFELDDCLAENPAAPAACDADRTTGLEMSGAGLIGEAVALEPRAQEYDLTDAYCGPEVCPAVVGGWVVMRDEHHLTASVARHLSPWIAAALDHALAGAAATEP